MFVTYIQYERGDNVINVILHPANEKSKSKIPAVEFSCLKNRIILCKMTYRRLVLIKLKVTAANLLHILQIFFTINLLTMISMV